MRLKSTENWFVLQGLGGKEKKIEEFLNRIETEYLKPFLPKKKLKIRKRGKQKEVIQPLYPGYIFIIGIWNLEEAKRVLQIPGAVKFVGGLNSPGVLLQEEKAAIKKIIKGDIAEYSKVVKVGSKIKILSGPLKELEGEIVSVDRRKQRAIVKLPLLNSKVKVTLGFEFIGSETDES